MKILHTLDTLSRGGAETLALDVCRNASANDLNLTFTACGGGELFEDFRDSGTDFYYFQRRLPFDPRLVFKLRQLIKKKGINIVHTHQAVEALHVWAAVRGLNVKLVLSHHGFIQDAKNQRALQFMIPRVDENVVVSRALLKWYLTETKLTIRRDFRILHNGVDAQRLFYQGDNLRHELNLASDALLCGMISNFYAAPRKDQKTLTEAFIKIAERVPNAHLVFVGKIEEGAENKFAECVKLAKSKQLLHRIHFLGMRRDVPKILAALDIFALSSLHEGLPIAAIEAMLTGIPCIFSDIEPLIETSDEGKTAVIFPTKDSDELAAKLLQMLTDKDFRERLAKKAKNFADENFSIESHIFRLKNLYNEILNK